MYGLDLVFGWVHGNGRKKLKESQESSNKKTIENKDFMNGYCAFVHVCMLFVLGKKGQMSP